MKSIVLAVALCLILAMPLLATTSNPVEAVGLRPDSAFDSSSEGYPTVGGEPLFSLHICVPESSFIAIETGNIISQSLRNIGIEGVVHPVPFFPLLLGLYPEDYGVSQYGFERPCPPGSPEIVTLSEPQDPHFQQETYDGKDVMWCGTDDSSLVTPPGYGNDWDESLTKQFTLPSGRSYLDYSIQYDVEPDYDFVLIEVSVDGVEWELLLYHTGVSPGFEKCSLNLTEYADQSVEIRFRFISDEFWSDEDGNYDSNGAFRLDWVEVTGSVRDEFESGFDGWVATAAPLEISVLQGYDITFHGLNFNEAYGVLGFSRAHSESLENQGYSNPVYDALWEELEAILIDWDANYPLPPDLTNPEGVRALEILEELQTIWDEEQPGLVLFNRMIWSENPGTGYPISPWNLKNEYLANPVIRQAINLALNRQAVLDLYGYEPPWETHAVDTWLAPWHPAFDPVSYAEYDPMRARQMLYDAGFTSVLVYNFGGILQPINADGSSVFKQGRTVPTKFQLFDGAGLPVTDACATIEVARISNNIIGDFFEVSSTSAADEGNEFRVVGNQYIFNLATKDLEPGTYIMRISIDDGFITQVFEVQFSLR